MSVLLDIADLIVCERGWGKATISTIAPLLFGLQGPILFVFTLEYAFGLGNASDPITGIMEGGILFPDGEPYI